MRTPLLLLAGAALLAPTNASADTGTRKNLAWDCEHLEVASSRKSVESIWLFLPEETVELPLVPSASGEKFQDARVLFWTKGNDQALLELKGEVYRCSVDPSRTEWEDAKLRGLDFRAIGQEPGWVLELSPERIVFLYDYGTRRLEVPRPEPSVDEEARRTVFATEADAWPFTLTLSGQECRDIMSGEAFETRVEVSWGPKLFEGCGRSLH